MARKAKNPLAFGLMAAELSIASWETIWRRTGMMARGECSPGEYQRMAIEKMQAAQLSMIAAMTGASFAAVMSPWHRRATANARRLRRRT